MSTATIDSGIPERSLQQRRDAIKRATEVRTRRSVLKRDLKAGRVRVVPLLLDPPEWLLTCKVFDVLRAMPHWGRVKAGRALQVAACSPSKTIGGLSERQRGELCRALAGAGR